MTTDEKMLLLKDLCARVPYGVEIQIIEWATLDTTLKTGHIARLLNNDAALKQIKPYLFPLSSMTEEQKKEYRKVCELDTEILSKHPMDGTPFPALYHSQNWLNKNHFDTMGLIPMGLANDATSKNIY